MSPEVALWAKTPEACKRLLVSRTHLYELRKAGILVEGTHFRHSGTINSPIVWDLGALEQALRSLSAPDPRISQQG